LQFSDCLCDNEMCYLSGKCIFFYYVIDLCFLIDINILEFQHHILIQVFVGGISHKGRGKYP